MRVGSFAAVVKLMYCTRVVNRRVSMAESRTQTPALSTWLTMTTRRSSLLTTSMEAYSSSFNEPSVASCLQPWCCTVLCMVRYG